MSRHSKKHACDCNPNCYAKKQCGIFTIASVDPSSPFPPTTDVSTVTIERNTCDGTIGNVNVIGPINVPGTNNYSYTLEIPITFDRPFRDIPIVTTSIYNYLSGLILPDIANINSIFSTVEVSTLGFVLKVTVVLTDLTLTPPGGANTLFREFLLPNARPATAFAYTAKACKVCPVVNTCNNQYY